MMDVNNNLTSSGAGAGRPISGSSGADRPISGGKKNLSSLNVASKSPDDSPSISQKVGKSPKKSSDLDGSSPLRVDDPKSNKSPRELML